MRVRILILLAAFLLLSLSLACSPAPARQSKAVTAINPSDIRQKESQPEPVEMTSSYDPPVQLGFLEDQTIGESSGLAASRHNPGLFWTHNDSDGGPFLYAFDHRGKKRGVWRVTGALARDWEDMAAGPGPQPGLSYLYVGDIGDNNMRRNEIIVYRVEEPIIAPADAASTKSNPRATKPAVAIRLKYPDGKHDAEALLVHPTTGDLYIITKAALAPAGVYRIAAAATLQKSGVSILFRVGEVQVPSMLGSIITGGDISPDGYRVALCDYLTGYEMQLPEGSTTSFDAIWKQPIRPVNVGPRQQGEAICYRLDGGALLTTSEKLPTPLIEVVRRHASSP